MGLGTRAKRFALVLDDLKVGPRSLQAALACV